ncbi:MAG TPA: 4-(cytidine 5'-diphospho)-2-C-methyl-D-erythritol kinase [Candidatus Acidoferrales bacterium]|jgi:4-diphosphocytidyl-2-C-methyl-D-erythritol kinase|nr:4-(cytidine 5'-diphospho)-2-C-methyl-D-erythritol kinase [Candidatus Acidoferrales bacterium]
MRLEKQSPCKVNLILNILGKRADGFHELETVMQPVNICDTMSFELAGSGLQLTCSHPELPVDAKNLVHRAATAFLAVAKISDGVRIHLQKNLPLAGGIGGGSANAAVTFTALNELFGGPLPLEKLHELAAVLGSDVPFFLYDQPALATGRGEKVETLDNFPALRGKAFFLVHPGFGISTPWSYQNLARFPAALNGRAGRAQELVTKLRGNDLLAAVGDIYNSLEAPAFDKFPVLSLYKEFLRENGAQVSLMSGSGSTTFAITESLAVAERLAEKFKGRFGDKGWMATVAI